MNPEPSQTTPETAPRRTNNPTGRSKAYLHALRDFELWGEVEHWGGAPAFDRPDVRCHVRRDPRRVSTWLLVHAQVDGFLRRQFGQDGVRTARRRWAEFEYVLDERGGRVKVEPSLPSGLERATSRYVSAYAREHVHPTP